MIVAEQAGRFDTIGIDCIAMNVNDLICVGAEPLALLDYIAVERADPDDARARSPSGCAPGAELAGVEIPGGEVCQVPEVIRGHPSPYGFDLVGSAFGTVALDAIVDGSSCRPGDALIGLPASGVHSNGLTLARRRARRRRVDAGRARRPEQSPTCCSSRPTIYVRAVARAAALGTRRSTGSRTSPAAALLNLLRIGDGVGYEISDAAAGARRCSS